VQDNRCIVPFTGAFLIDLPNNTVSPCCKLPKFLIKNGKILTEEIIELRKDIISNKRNVMCNGCWDNEDKYGTSFRLSHSLQIPPINNWNTVHTDKEVDSVTLFFSNKCQMKCVYCGPHASSMWGKSLKNTIKLDLHELINLDKIVHIGISGGEPLLEHDAIDFLNTLLPDIKRRILINTNLSYGTAVFNKLKTIINIHKNVNIITSLDSIGNNVTRKYMNWDLWKRNFEELANELNDRKLLCKDVWIGICITVTLLNYKNVEDIIKYVISFKRAGIKGITFFINPLNDLSLVSVRSGNILPEYSVSLTEEELAFLNNLERYKITAYNRYMDGVTIDTDLKILSEEYLENYMNEP
jgi:organic radical activating enzyme